jgi:hypothetical protein
MTSTQLATLPEEIDSGAAQKLVIKPVAREKDEATAGRGYLTWPSSAPERGAGKSPPRHVP